MDELWLARHGETEWSRDGRHTGRTDVALTAEGIRQAEALGRRLQGIHFDIVLTSPLLRARTTAEAAGIGDFETSTDLEEFDYGHYEGLTFAEITEQRPNWNLWRDGCPGGETPALAADRVDRVVKRALSFGGRVLMVSHGHIGRILAARFIGLPGEAGGLLAFDVACLSVLGYERERPVILFWNQKPEVRP
ncbi:MAG: histidine phosphatase family protein [Actinomycetota bacterium]|nr:histidine phosphatase family protein [Actinomycetota bacterium]